MKREQESCIISSAFEPVATVDGIITTICKKHIARYEDADNYLKKTILEKRIPTDEDMEIAARLYAIPMMHKTYRNIAKTLYKADELCKKRIQESGESITDVSDDWLLYFMDKVSVISEESVQSIFACILTQECCENGTMRKVMIDRLALLDRKSAQLFSTLCQLTYNVENNSGIVYSIPLYLRDNTLRKLIKSKKTGLSEEQVIEYQKMLTANGRDTGITLTEIEHELEILQEIGLIHLSEDGDEGDIYSINPETFYFRIGTEDVGQLSLFDKRQKIYYACTGNVTYTKMGLDLYNSLKTVYSPYPELCTLLKAYIRFQENK